MALTQKQIQKRWDANQKAVQDAKAAAVEARDRYTDACLAMSAISGRPGWRRRLLLDELTREERVEMADADEDRQAAYQAVVEADRAVEEAKAVFKAGIPEEGD